MKIEKLSMAELGRLSVDEFRDSEKFPIVLVLDNVRSGLNVGSVFRTADAFALEKILLCGITGQPPHREILKTALGSTDSVAWQYFEKTTDAVLFLKKEGFRVFGIEQTSPKTWLQDFSPFSCQILGDGGPEISEKLAFVFGNEVEGVSEEVLKTCDGSIEIPQFGTKHSLNIAVSVGIVVWEVCKKIRFTTK